MTENAIPLIASAAQERRSTALSLPGVIGFVFAFRTCLTFLFFQDDPVLGTEVYTGLSVGMLLLAMLRYAGAPLAYPTLRVTASSLKSPLKWIAAFVVLAFVSLGWSSGPRLSAAGYWATWATDIATTCFVLRYYPRDLHASSLMKGFVVGASLLALVAWSIPTLSDLRLGNEDYLHPNTIAHFVALGALIAIYLGREEHIWRIPAFALAITVIRTLSKTSIIAFIAALAFHFLRDSSLTRAARIRIGILTTVVLASFAGLLESYFDSYAQSTSPETLTGRTFLWTIAGRYALENPWLGHGFYSFRTVIPLMGSFEAVHAHNELLQQFFTFGAAGVVMFFGIYAAFYWQIRHSARGHLRTLATALLIFALVRGLTDTEPYDLSFPLWLMAMLSILLSSAAQTATPPAPEPSLPAPTPLQ